MSFTKVSVAGIGTTGTITFTNVNVAGVITATSFVGSGSQLTGVASTDNIRTNTNATFLQNINVTGIVTAAGVNASGVITATSFSGSGANLTGLAATANVTTSSLVVIGVSTVAAGTTAAPSITPTGDSNTGIFFPSADTVAIGEGGAEAARFDSSGRLLLGTSTAPSAGNAQYSKLVVQANTYAATDYGILNLQRGQAASGGITGNLGGIHFSDNTGNEFGLIQCAADGTTSAGDYPGRLYFSTTADGASSPTEAMRINNQRELLIGTTTRTANGGVLQVSNGITFPATQSACSNANTLDDYEEGTYTPVLSGGGYTYTSGGYTTGRYTKIGRIVTVEAGYNISAISGSSNGSSVRITLPFAPSDLYVGGRWCQVLCRLAYFSSSSIQRVYCAQLTTNSSSADIVYYYTSGGNGTDTPVNIGADYDASSNNGQIAFVMTYVTS